MNIWRFANILSFANGIAGTFAVFFAAMGDYVLAGRLVMLAMFFDSLDGPIARWQGPTEEGKTLDRFSDRITQCVAPATILVVFSSFHPISFILGGALVFTGLLRLIRTDAAKDKPGIGLPLSPSAFFIVCGTLLNFPLAVIFGVLALSIAMSLIEAPLTITPNFLRGPVVSKKDWRQFVFIALRSLPLLAFVILPMPHLKIAGWILFSVMGIFTIAAIVNAANYIVKKRA